MRGEAGTVDCVSHQLYPEKSNLETDYSHISDVEEDPTILGSSSSPVEIVALCGGLLPAAAVLAAKDSNQLFALSKDIISVGLRLAVEVHRRAQLIERTPSSWGKTYTGLPVEKVQKILDEFHTAEVRAQYPRCHRSYPANQDHHRVSHRLGELPSAWKQRIG